MAPLETLSVAYSASTGDRVRVTTNFGLMFELSPVRDLALPLTPCCGRGFRTARTPHAKPECELCRKAYASGAQVGGAVTQELLLPWVEAYLPPLEATLVATELWERSSRICQVHQLIDSPNGRGQAMGSYSGLLFP